MAHPFAKFNEQDAGKARAKAFTKKQSGGPVTVATDDTKSYPAGMQADRAARIASTKRADAEPAGRKSGGRLDKFARGGRAKGKNKGNNTKINIVVAPKGPHPSDGAAPPAPLGLPPMGGGPPPGPPPGLGAGPPGLPPGIGGPKPPGMMARGGRLKLKGGAETGPGRLSKAKAYKARG